MSHKLFKVNQNAIIRNSSGKVLILERKGKWMLPGGRLEENEDWVEGLKREIQEETGITDFIIEKPLEIHISDGGETYVITFLCSVSVEDPVIQLSDEHQGYIWLSVDSINTYQFWHESIPRRIRNVLSGKAKLA